MTGLIDLIQFRYLERAPAQKLISSIITTLVINCVFGNRKSSLTFYDKLLCKEIRPTES